MKKEVMTGNQAVAMAVKFSGVQFVSAYPITPQTSIVEKISFLVEKGLMKAKFVNTESEHSALAMAYGAALGGVRSFTATSSHGLLYMHEWVHWVSRSRVPLVMAVVTRTIGPPWNIWPDHSDYMDQRDAGWIMLFAADVQEAFDMTVQAFKISEDERVFIPVIVGLEGFIVGSTSMPVFLPDEEAVTSWVGDRKQPFVFDGSQNITLGNLTSPEDTYLIFKNLHQDLINSLDVIKEIEKNYANLFDRQYLGPIEIIGERESLYSIISMGAWSGDIFEATKRIDDSKITLHRIRIFRPFPCKDLVNEINDKEGVIVFDRSISFGSHGPLYMDVKACLNQRDIKVVNIIGGIGGVNHDIDEYVLAIRRAIEILRGKKGIDTPLWMGESR